MATYVLLGNITDQGARTIKELPQRAKGAEEMASKFGIRIKERLVTLGQYDVVLVVEAPDDAAVSAFSLNAASRGTIKFQTLRGFSAEEIERIIGRLS